MYSLSNLKDVLFVDSGDPWNPRPETVNKVMSMLQQVHRVLKPDGIFISITFGQVLGMWKQESVFLNSNHAWYMKKKLNLTWYHILYSHISDALSSRLRNLLGQLTGELLVMDFTISSTSWKRSELDKL